MQNWYLPLMLVTFVLLEKMLELWPRLTHHKSISVETFVPRHRWSNGFKTYFNLNRTKVSIKVVMEDIAAEKFFTTFPGKMKDNLIQTGF